MRLYPFTAPLLAALLIAAKAHPQATLQPDAPAAVAQSRWPETVVPDPDGKTRREMLVSHGIRPLPAELISYLRNGFPADATLPGTPIMKTEVTGAVIEELGLTGERSAVPVLIEIVERKGPAGLSAVLQRDFENQPIESVEQQLPVLRRVLSLNAIVALGLIGDLAAEEPILATMRTETGTAFTTRGAEALALMGSTKGIAAVVLLASDHQSADSVAAFATLYAITGRNYGYTENTSLQRRREIIAQMRTWYETEGAAQTVLRADVLRRLQNPAIPAPLDPASTRGLLRQSNDLSDYDRRYEARKTLMDVAPNSFDELRAIALDPAEDIDIRRAAMRWIAVGNPSKSRSTIRKLRKDENPLIAETATVIEKDIPKYIEEQKRAK